MVKRMFTNFLPIGSVVKLKECEKRVMIFGYYQLLFDEDEDGFIEEEYDYIGVPYPEGNMGEDFQLLFNQSDIDKVIFEGYKDKERDLLISEIENYVNEIEEGDY